MVLTAGTKVRSIPLGHYQKLQESIQPELMPLNAIAQGKELQRKEGDF